MSTFASWLAVLGLWVVATLCAAALARRLIRAPDPAVDLHGFLRHPTHRHRCACQRYGLPDDRPLAIRDHDGLHEAARCQPVREELPGGH